MLIYQRRAIHINLRSKKVDFFEGIKFDYNSNIAQGLDIIEVRHIDKMDSGPAKANRFYFYYIRGGFVFILYGLLDV